MKYFKEITKRVKEIYNKLLDGSVKEIENNEELTFEEQKIVRNEIIDLANRFEKNCNDKVEILMDINFEKLSNSIEKIDCGN